MQACLPLTLGLFFSFHTTSSVITTDTRDRNADIPLCPILRFIAGRVFVSISQPKSRHLPSYHVTVVARVSSTPTEMSVQHPPASPPRLTEREPTCLIESQPIDVHVALMSECASLEDLSAIIHASPILYRSFLTAKRTILLALLVRDLGPGIRDAVALALIDNLDSDHQAYVEQAEQAIQQYLDLPPAMFATKKVSTDTVAKMVQINRTIQFWTDFYASTALTRVQSRRATGSYPITLHERHRIAQALLRYQTMMNICPVNSTNHGGLRGGRDLGGLRRSFFGMFPAWQMEQVYEIHVFLHKFKPTDNGIRGLDYHSQVYSLEHVRAMHTRDLQDIIAYRRRICAEASVPQLRRYNNIDKFNWSSTDSHDAAWIWMSGSHHFPTIPAAPLSSLSQHLLPDFPDILKHVVEREQIYSLELNKPKFTPGQNAVPYGWRDAMGGLDCCRWGDDLLCVPGPETTDNDWTRAKVKMNTWRHLGFMFWDENRIELIKTHVDVVKDFRTDWLVNIWEDMPKGGLSLAGAYWLG
ncbi:hypothetical protein GGR57DRAFT_453110 [Xylariaceae sp. FL1272]|nr:hypothetical protein GGR57DRAFT_453110 [Xylariaceae sp. FL1272]